jgi:hypothetical protein
MEGPGNDWLDRGQEKGERLFVYSSIGSKNNVRIGSYINEGISSSVVLISRSLSDQPDHFDQYLFWHTDQGKNKTGANSQKALQGPP